MVTAANSAPVLNAAGTPTFTAVAEDSANPAGDSVSALIASGGAGYITDVDVGALQGIAVIGSDTTNGTWQYSTDGGTTGRRSAWFPPARPGCSRRTRPTSSASCRTPASLARHHHSAGVGPDERYQRVHREHVPNGGTTAFSIATDSASVSVTAVNDAPSFTKGADRQ